MKKNNIKRKKLISIDQIIVYAVWLAFLLVITMYFSSKRNEYLQEIDNKIQSVVVKYGYTKDENMSDKNNLYYKSGNDSSIQIRLEYDKKGYVLDHCEFEYESYDDSSYKIDYYYDVIDSILPEINIREYKEQIDYAIENKLYEEDGAYMITLNTENGRYGHIFIHDNITNYRDYEYNISVQF